MFYEKFNALMNIAEVSNSLLGRGINMNPSHIGRLRSGVRPLPKNHDYLLSMCRYISSHIKKDYQINALGKLTGIGSSVLSSPEDTALFLENWLTEQEHDTSEATGRFISGFSRLTARASTSSVGASSAEEAPQCPAPYLYGNGGKRRAVEQFFTAILHEKTPQTLLLFSDENMEWLYEDKAFAARWAELFGKVILKGNRVKIIHTISRDMNEMLEAVTKWIPIYMTGMIEPYYYPRIRDGVFRRTVFLAPSTAAVVSSSVQQDTDGMLNMFLTDREALDALKSEYEHYLALCRPLMNIYTPRDSVIYEETALRLARVSEDSYIYSSMPPLFGAPEDLVLELSENIGDRSVITKWKQGSDIFRENIKKQHITLIMLNPEDAVLIRERLFPYDGGLTLNDLISYTPEQYIKHINHLKHLEEQCKNLKLCFVSDLDDKTLLYVKENTGVIMASLNSPGTAFVINERNMVSAFRDYLEKTVIL